MLKIALEICKGVSCLHFWEPQIVHRDLKSHNLLVIFYSTFTLPHLLHSLSSFFSPSLPFQNLASVLQKAMFDRLRSLQGGNTRSSISEINTSQIQGVHDDEDEWSDN